MIPYPKHQKNIENIGSVEVYKKQEVPVRIADY